MYFTDLFVELLSSIESMKILFGHGTSHCRLGGGGILTDSAFETMHFGKLCSKICN